VLCNCHAERLVLRKWNWLCVSGCEWNSQCGTSASVCLVIVLKYVVIENECASFNIVMTCNMFVWWRAPYMLNILCSRKRPPDQILLGISEPVSLARWVRWLGRGYPVPVLAPQLTDCLVHASVSVEWDLMICSLLTFTHVINVVTWIAVLFNLPHPSISLHTTRCNIQKPCMVLTYGAFCMDLRKAATFSLLH